MARTTTIEAMAIGFYSGKWHIIAEGTWALCQTARAKQKHAYKETKTIYYTNKSNYNL